MDKLHVVIVGAGMGGLTAALALRQAGYGVEVYDRAPVLAPAGAGVSLWSNGIKVLNRLGLGAAVRAIGGPMQHMSYVSKSGELLTHFSLEPLVRAVGQRPYPVARTDLQRMLLDAVGAGHVTLGAECIAVEQDASSATAVFAHGHRARADLVVGADGTHSIIRSGVLGERVERRYVGYVNFNGLVSQSDDLAPSDTWVTYVGDHQRASLMPVGGGRFYYFFDVPLARGAAPVAPDVASELAHHFAGWPAPVQALIQRLDPGRVTRGEIFDIEPLPKLVSGRVALLGDAAHSTAPDLGQGGCQAMEDAWMLAHVLLTNDLGVEDALLRYQAGRLERTADIIRRARKRSDVTHGIEPEKTLEWYAELAQEDGSSIMRALASTILGGPMQ
ncbi:MAG TPA: FAD-dependent urate hydroxylase HpxO [Polyangiaceae bacterium]|nr:FAD-dependent urate hydroxylase HpxO [Polyangiaceae bacterium]